MIGIDTPPIPDDLTLTVAALRLCGFGGERIRRSYARRLSAAGLPFEADRQVMRLVMVAIAWTRPETEQRLWEAS